MLNLVLNLSNLGNGLQNLLALMKSSLPDYLSIYFNQLLLITILHLSKPLNILHYYCKTDTLKNSFFPKVINKWNELDKEIKGATSFFLFKASLLKTGRPHANSTYRIHDPIGIKLLMHLGLGLSHLNEHKFRHNFTACVNSLCSYSIKPETTLHFLHCHNFLKQK